MEVTRKLIDIPDASSAVEYQAGQFTADSMTFTGKDIQWWTTNVLTGAAKYLELKVNVYLVQGNTVTTDNAVVFSGFVDDIRQQNNTDHVEFTVYTAQDVASRTPAEILTAQYINPDVDGSGLSGLAMPNIPYMYITDAAILGYELQLGTHTIEYDYNNGAHQARLDGGRWVPLAPSTGFFVLGNSETPEDDAERLQIYIADTNAMTRGDDEVADNLVVIDTSERLPRQWHKFVGVDFLMRHILRTGFEIPDDVFDEDAFTLPTFEIPAAKGLPKVSFVDIPPADESIIGLKPAIVALTSDGEAVALFIAVGSRVYLCDPQFNFYFDLELGLDPELTVVRMWWSERTEDLWILATDDLNSPDFVSASLFRFNGTLESVNIGCSPFAIELIDFDWSGAGDYRYGIVYYTGTGQVREVDGTAVTDALLFSATTFGSPTPGNWAGQRERNKFMFHAFAGTYRIFQISLDGSGAWNSDGAINTDVGSSIIRAGYSDAEDRLYFVSFNSSAEPVLRGQAVDGGQVTDIYTFEDDDVISGMQYISDRVWFVASRTGYLRSIRENMMTVEDGRTFLNIPRYFPFTSFNGRIYGLEGGLAGRRFQFSTVLSMYVSLANFEGTNVTDALYRILNAFMLVANISSTKRIQVRHRWDPVGELPQTSGETMTVDTRVATDIQTDDTTYKGVEFVSVSNDNVTVTYNGTDFNKRVLSTARRAELSNTFIPDQLVEDIAFYAYQFFHQSRVVYTIPTGAWPSFQYEPLDNFNGSFSGTNIEKTIIGEGYPIYGLRMNLTTGDMEVQVLV